MNHDMIGVIIILKYTLCNLLNYYKRRFACMFNAFSYFFIIVFFYYASLKLLK